MLFRHTNTAKELRAKLNSAGVNMPHINDGELKHMLNRVKTNEVFFVSLADIEAGQALITGRNQPIVEGAPRFVAEQQ